MNKKIYENALDEEIAKQLEAVGQTGLGDKELNSRIEGVVELIDRSVKLEELRISEETKYRAQEQEYLVETAKLESEKKGRRNDILAKLGFMLLSAGFTAWGVLYTTKAELVDGYIPSTSAGKNLINSLFKFKEKN